MKSDGFTLTELIAVIILVSILSLIAVPSFFAISKSVNNNEYESKKSYIESIAVRYAEEHNATTSQTITATRLIASGYLTADKYVEVSGEDIPFIINPKDKNDNMACHPISLSFEEYDYKAKMSDDTNCNIAVEDTIADKLNVKAYEIEGTVVGKQIAWDIENRELKEVATDVLLVINPTYLNFNSVNISFNGSNKTIDKKKMLTNPYNGMILNADNYTNVVVVRAQKILNADVAFNAQTSMGLKSCSIKVKINKDF